MYINSKRDVSPLSLGNLFKGEFSEGPGGGEGCGADGGSGLQRGRPPPAPGPEPPGPASGRSRAGAVRSGAERCRGLAPGVGNANERLAAGALVPSWRCRKGLFSALPLPPPPWSRAGNLVMLLGRAHLFLCVLNASS